MAALTSGTSSGGRMLVNRLPGPATITSARSSASHTSGTQRGRSGSRPTRRMRPPAEEIAVSPLITRPSANSATSVTSSLVAGSTVPRAPTTCAAISTARGKSLVTSASAVSTRLPMAWPFSPSPDPKRYWKMSAISESLSDSAARQFRMSPGGMTLNSARSFPELPPSSDVATMATSWSRRPSRGSPAAPQSRGRSPRSTLGRPVPPPIAATRGCEVGCWSVAPCGAPTSGRAEFWTMVSFTAGRQRASGLGPRHPRPGAASAASASLISAGACAGRPGRAARSSMAGRMSRTAR